MATLTTTRVHVAGRGHIFHADPDTDPMDIASFIFGDETTYGGWTWIGQAAKDSLVDYSTSGGEATVLDTWDQDAVMTIYSKEDITATFSVVNVDSETFLLAFGGAEVTAAGSIRVGTNPVAVERAFLIVMVDATGIAAMHHPRVSVKGSFPQFSTDAFTAIPLTLTLLGSQTKVTTETGPLRWEWFKPVKPAGAGG